MFNKDKLKMQTESKIVLHFINFIIEKEIKQTKIGENIIANDI